MTQNNMDKKPRTITTFLLEANTKVQMGKVVHFPGNNVFMFQTHISGRRNSRKSHATPMGCTPPWIRQGLQSGKFIKRNISPLFYMLLLLIFLSSGCTLHALPNREAVLEDFESATNVQEMIALVNDHPGACERFDWMEGYVKPDLFELQEMGLLDIKRINPLFIPLGILGYAGMKPGTTGDIAECRVRYAGLYLLAHELMHCLGCKEGKYTFDPFTWGKSYTDQQVAIMEAEGVQDWISTSVYKTEDPTYHLPQGVKHP